MLIERKSVIAFDEIQERERIGLNFEGEVRSKLLEILDAFVASEWSNAVRLVRTLDRSERDYLAPAIWDVLSEIKRREDHLESARQRASAAGRSLTPEGESVLENPTFTVVAPAYGPNSLLQSAAQKERSIYVPRTSVNMLLAGPRSRHSINVVIPYRGFEVSIAAAAVDMKSDLRMSTVRIYQDCQDMTSKVFGVDDSANVDATASMLQQAFKAIDRLLATPDIPVMEQMG